MKLSIIELVAVLFTGVAGAASAVQAYVSWETRGEVSRAIVFAERLDACAEALAAIQPFVEKAGPEGRELVASGDADGRYSLPAYYYRVSAGTPKFDAEHMPRVERWRRASAALAIVAPNNVEERVGYFETVIAEEIEAGKYMSQAEMIAWLQKMDDEATALKEECRALLEPQRSVRGGKGGLPSLLGVGAN